ncbi:serine threonine protein kinase [Stylonychia lemnae]|uniref:Serine threonine protein kinase n=1 Tax=Stylonychia lemnae TaxID=5949 RepID=A0A078AKD7_STYLE|nr:serine threonine protein kinase [Stylonychia lemnae]|eukprot:CDW82356.1 serine threonine protein kinase [Stylonychia lemnae]
MQTLGILMLIRFMSLLGSCTEVNIPQGYPNISQLQQVFQTETQYNLVFEYQENGTLLNFIEKKEILKESIIKKIMFQLLTALKSIHHKKIIHRDLKLENILVLKNNGCLDDNIQVEVIDFGLACSENNFELICQKSGTPGYVAPEILNKQPASFKSDIFSLGCIFYNLITKRLLFGGRDTKEIIRKNQFENPLMKLKNIWNKLSKDGLNLITRMLDPNPIMRLDAEQCLQQNRLQFEGKLKVQRDLTDLGIQRGQLHTTLYNQVSQQQNKLKEQQKNSFTQSINISTMKSKLLANLNNKQEIKEQLESILTQEFQQFDIVAQDDSSINIYPLENSLITLKREGRPNFSQVKGNVKKAFVN